jgi:DeoR family glycerol-3-phosphate regulon repressor
MRPKVRQEKIVDVIRRQRTATVEELAVVFSTSHETIRRDLTVLAESGEIQKIHGGAKIPRILTEGSFGERMVENASAKRSIAVEAAKLISPGETLFIDTGSTTLAFAEEIARIPDLIVITNSTSVAKAIGKRKNSISIYLLGGAYDPDNQECYGPLAIAQLKNFHAKRAILTIWGMHAKAGITDFNIEEAQIAKAMVEQSEKVTVLADATKFDRTGNFMVCSLSDVDNMVTDVAPEGSLGQMLVNSDVDIVSCCA